MPTDTIHVLMSRVMKDVTAIEKSQRNQHFNFNFRGIDDVMNALHGPLTKHGVFYAPEVLEQEIIRGDKQWHATLRVRYTFYGPAGDSVSSVVTAEGLDSADKAATKAMSTALKYALLQVFCIPTEEQREMDPDRSNETWQSPRPEQAPSPSPKTGGKASGEAVSDVAKPEQSGPQATSGSGSDSEPGTSPAPGGGEAEESRVWGSARGSEADPSSGDLIKAALEARKIKGGQLLAAATNLAIQHDIKASLSTKTIFDQGDEFLTALADHFHLREKQGAVT